MKRPMKIEKRICLICNAELAYNRLNRHLNKIHQITMEQYEIQILDSYENPTYVNGQAAAVYKQHIPLVNASRKPGQWQSYDIIFTAPSFKENGDLESPARVTVIHNGVLIQNNVTILGPTDWVMKPVYKKHDDKEYINMILQILINLRLLQLKINLHHRDMKPKNILYKTLDTNVKFTYELNDKKYNINTNIIFYITDFGHSISDISDTINKKYITQDSDLYELSMLPQRIKVDKIIKEYKFF
jgi:serine/threonine protein kinase